MFAWKDRDLVIGLLGESIASTPRLLCPYRGRRARIDGFARERKRAIFLERDLAQPEH